MARARRKWTSEEDTLLRGVVRNGRLSERTLSPTSQGIRPLEHFARLIDYSHGPFATAPLARVSQIGSRPIKQRLPQEMVEQPVGRYSERLVVRRGG